MKTQRMAKLDDCPNGCLVYLQARQSKKTIGIEIVHVARTKPHTHSTRVVAKIKRSMLNIHEQRKNDPRDAESVTKSHLKQALEHLRQAQKLEDAKAGGAFKN